MLSSSGRHFGGQHALYRRVGSSTYYLVACFHLKCTCLQATLSAKPFFMKKVDVVADIVISISQVLGAVAVLAIGATLLGIALGKIRV